MHPNTRDDGVITYLGKYGKIVTNKVVYGTFRQGPLMGIKNGDRSFKVEVNAGNNIGTYLAVDGQRVTLRYPGQLQTCARCHETAVVCKGGAIARKCEAAQGAKVEFSDYILKLWQKIGYVPGEVEMAAVYDDQNEFEENSEKVLQQNGGGFTPAKQASEPDKFSGVRIRQFPKETDHGDIMEFLVNSGLPENLKESVSIKNNGSVAILNLGNGVCLQLINNIHNQFHFGRRLFCNGFIPLTPEKEAEAVTKTPEKEADAVAEPPAPEKVAEDTAENHKMPDNLSQESQAPGTLSDSTSSLPGIFLPESSPNDLSVPALVRRYSLSLPAQPPACSFAAEIMNSNKSLLYDIKDIKDQLSDFGSCVSEQSDSSSDQSERYTLVQRKLAKLLSNC